MFILAIGDVVEAFGGWVVMGVVVNWGVYEWVFLVVREDIIFYIYIYVNSELF